MKLRSLLSSLLLMAAVAAAVVPATAGANEARGGAVKSKPTPKPTKNAFNATPLADTKAAPWAVLVQTFNAAGVADSRCTGSIVSPTVVVTAAHCVTDDDNNPLPPPIYRVFAGGAQETNPGNQVLGVSSIAVHPNYRGFRFGSDVALLVLNQPLALSDLVSPIRLTPAGKTVKLGTQLSFFGWGITESGLPEGLRAMKTRAIISAGCAPGVPGIMCTNSKTQVPCPGDSGGGLVRGTREGPELVAVDSFGGPDCEVGLPDGFADLTQPSLNKWVTAGLAGQAYEPGLGPVARKRPRVKRVTGRTRELRCTGARWSGANKVTTQWIYGNGQVFKTGGRRYTAKRGQIGRPIFCVSSARNQHGTASLVSRQGYRFIS